MGRNPPPRPTRQPGQVGFGDSASILRADPSVEVTHIPRSRVSLPPFEGFGAQLPPGPVNPSAEGVDSGRFPSHSATVKIDVGFETIGDRLRRLRLERGLSQRALSSPGISCAYISRIEAGARQPSVKALRKLAPQLGVTVEYLETGRQETNAERRELRLADAELELRLGRDLEVAQTAFAEILEEALTEGDITAVVRAQAGVGLAAFALGDSPGTVVRLEAAIGSGQLSPLTNPDVYVSLGVAYIRLGTPERAVELLELCLEEAEGTCAEDSALTIRYSSQLSQALADLGEYARAERVIVDALRSVGDEAGPLERVRLHWALARIADAGSHVAVALDHMHKAIALLELMDDELYLGRAHLQAATLLMSSDKFIQAGRHLQAADRCLGASTDPLDHAFVKIEESRRATGLGSAAEGVTLAREALELLGRDNPNFQGAAYCALAEALGALGDSEGALSAFGAGVARLEETGQWREAADACTSWGRYLRSLGRSEQAVAAFDRAAALSGRVRRTGSQLLTATD